MLYEIDKPIEGFGREKDPRIKKILDQRNPDQDMLTIFECTEDQIARNTAEINAKTVVYIGHWNPDVYHQIKYYPNIKHLYEQFPDEKIFMMTLKTDPVISSPKTAEQFLQTKNIWLSDWAKEILDQTPFSTEKQAYQLVQFTVGQLGFRKGATMVEIYNKAKMLGLELCPAEVGPHLRLQYQGRDWKWIAMEPIAVHRGGPLVFGLDAAGVELGLGARIAVPAYGWFPYYRFVFLSRSSTAPGAGHNTQET